MIICPDTLLYEIGENVIKWKWRYVKGWNNTHNGSKAMRWKLKHWILEAGVHWYRDKLDYICEALLSNFKDYNSQVTVTSATAMRILIVL